MNNVTIDELFSQYIDVVNEAIAANRGDFYGKVIKLWEKAFGNRPIAFGVYTDDADDIDGWYTVELDNGRLEIVSQTKDPKAKLSAKINRCYLEQVVADPDDYIEHPIKLDLMWLKTRIAGC